MIEDPKPVSIELVIGFDPDYLPIDDAPQYISQTEAGGGKLGAFLRKALNRLEQLIIDWIDQLPDDPESAYPYVWGGIWSLPRYSRFRRYM